jgi:acyl-CoA thioesterase
MSESQLDFSAAGKRPATIAEMNAYSATVPFNAWLGAEVISTNSNRITLRIPWRVEFAAAPGLTHGGVLAGAIETAAFMVLRACRGDAGPTIDMRIDYHRSSINGTLYAHARLLRAGGTISTAEVFIHDSGEHLIASGRCVFLSCSRSKSDLSIGQMHD